MRIENIAVSNFGSYAEASLDLREVSAAVVVGINGAGKSTLVVDSVLWALFAVGLGSLLAFALAARAAPP